MLNYTNGTTCVFDCGGSTSGLFRSDQSLSFVKGWAFVRIMHMGLSDSILGTLTAADLYCFCYLLCIGRVNAGGSIVLRLTVLHDFDDLRTILSPTLQKLSHKL